MSKETREGEGEEEEEEGTEQKKKQVCKKRKDGERFNNGQCELYF